ncbi:MAG: hypothetical protein OP8BY_1120 [Candidatus Saccharicenans subterraneus]|uniref:DEAD/DEAH box helicase n=1 Tax=Candidatus Saccharicenans subterraneus TaxID=2508984 RepID=A0A3E2BJU2_9BACT|nr:MAG: hypothetical protein OP8BY_1120 [Candidatus Saccharicenans subterraneum]
MLPENYKKIWIAFFDNFDELREIQKKAIEPILSGQNAFIISATGSGKTEAAVAPLVARHFEFAKKNDSPFLLYITPTRALVNDLRERLEVPLGKIGLTLGIKHGDKDDLKKQKKPNVIITTPESFDVLLYKKDSVLSQIQAVIFDELHVLYNTQRGLHLAILFNRLQARRENNIQWVASSATISNVDDYLDFFFPNIDKHSVRKLIVPSERSLESLICPVADPIKLFKRLLLERGINKVLVFTNSRKKCEELVQIIKIDKELGEIIYCHYSSLSPEVRVNVERDFSRNNCGVCVATSTLELGIDIGNIDCIVLWDVPPSIESFLQRVGRGNRREKTNRVICVIPGEDRNKILSALKFLSLNELAIRGELPEKKPYGLFGSIVQQSLNIIASNNGSFIQRSKLYQNFKFLNHIREDIFYEILEGLTEQGYLIKHGFLNSYGAGDKLYELVDSLNIYSNISGYNNKINIKTHNLELGTIPIENLKRIKVGDQILLAGRIWDILQIKSYIIRVEQAKEIKKLQDIVYTDEYPIAESYLIDNIWKLIHNEDIREVLKQVALHRTIEESLINLINIINNHFSYLSIPFIKSYDKYIYFTFGGELINGLLSFLFNDGCAIYDDVVAVARSQVNWDNLDNIIKKNKDYLCDKIIKRSQMSLYQKLLPESLKREELLEQLRKDSSWIGIIERLKHSSCVPIKENEQDLLMGLSCIEKI